MQSVSKNILPTSSQNAEHSGSEASVAPKSKLRSMPSRIAAAFRAGAIAFSDWLLEWTPFCMVVTYFIVTTAIFCLCNAEAIKVFYFFYMSTTFYIAAACVVESFLGLTPVREARKAAMIVESNGGYFPSDLNGKADSLPIIDLVIVAYLPNEKDIIRNQVLYACEELVYPQEKLRINLVYNTPKAIEPLETELALLPEQYKNLRVIKVPGSKSKADNLNYFFNVESDADVIGIFDSDHCPHPHNPRWVAERFLADQTVDIVQGRCIVYNTKESFYAQMVAVEFDKIYAISHPGRSRMFGFGLFCGSNGYWKAPLLRAHKMHGDMLTEDIDSALRAYGLGKKAVHDMNVTSFEMAPNTFAALWKQRLRWAQGWTQASYRHMPLAWTNPPNGKRGADERFGIVSLLLVREISYYLVSQHTCLLISFVIVDWPHNVGEFVRLIFFRYPMSEWFFFATIIALLFTLYFTEKVRSEFTTRWSMLVFSIVYIPYLILMAVMGLYGHARQMIKYSSWNPTTRK